MRSKLIGKLYHILWVDEGRAPFSHAIAQDVDEDWLLMQPVNPQSGENRGPQTWVNGTNVRALEIEPIPEAVAAPSPTPNPGEA